MTDEINKNITSMGVTWGNASLLTRPPNVRFSPDASPQASDWVIENISTASFVNEAIIEQAYSDRRKAGRKIRQQRRKLRRTNAEFGHGPGEGVPESILRSRVGYHQKAR